MRIVAVDPGKTTGFAFHNTETGFVDAWERDWIDVVRYIDDFAENYVDEIVVEGYVPRPGIRSWEPDVMYCIGALIMIAFKYGIPIHMQSPADAKNFATNDKLKRLHWYKSTPGGHTNDALRHLLLHCVREHLIEPEVFTH